MQSVNDLSQCFNHFIIITIETNNRVETRSGRPGHVLLRSSRSDLFIKYLGLTQILHWITGVDNGVWC